MDLSTFTIEEEKIKFKALVHQYLTAKQPITISLHYPTNFQLDILPDGIRTPLVSLLVDNNEAFIIRGFKRKDKLKKIVAVSRHMISNGLNIPKIIHSDSSRKTFRKYGYFISIERKISGITFDKFIDNRDKILLIAQYFAQMHGVTRPYWGSIGFSSFFKRWELHSLFLYSIKKWLRELKNLEPQFTANMEKKCWHWFKNYKPLIKRYKIFSLVHRDPHPKNLLISNDNKVYLLDLDRVKYFPPLIDIAYISLSKHLAPDDLLYFKQSYLSNLPPLQQEEYEKCMDFYKGFVKLSRATNHFSGIKELPDENPRKQHCRTKLTECCKVLQELILES